MDVLGEREALQQFFDGKKAASQNLVYLITGSKLLFRQ